MKIVIIQRFRYRDDQTEGNLYVLDGQNISFKCKTLELPWLNNRYRISCIPQGIYNVKKRYSEDYGNHFHIQDVPERDMILIHHGNYKQDTLGCVLVGKKHIDINYLSKYFVIQPS